MWDIILWCLVFLAFLITCYILIEPYLFKLRTFDLEFDNLPKAFDGYSILFISDVHTSKFGYFEKKLSSFLSNLDETDICIIGGDLVYRESAMPGCVRLMKSVKSKNGIYFVSGNSEYKSHNNHEKIIRFLENNGLTNIDNKNLDIKKNYSFISIVGIDDPTEEKHDLESAFENVKINVFKICVTHNPSIIDDLLIYRPNLILTGHTHGGQVRLPLLNIVYTHMKKNKWFNDGLYTSSMISEKLKTDVSDCNLLVSRGFGTSKLWIRFRCRPEAHIITLRLKR